jgi:CHASE2 domain-containing sensor protein
MYTASQTVGYYLFLNFQNSLTDSFGAFYQERVSLPDSIVIVDVDDASIRELGNFDQWPRKNFAAVISRVNEDGARLVFLDVMLMRGGSRLENRALVDTVGSAGNVILGYYFDLDTESTRRRPIDAVYSGNLPKPGGGNPGEIEYLRALDMNLPYLPLAYSARKLGFTNCIPDLDGVYRHMPLYIAYDSSVLSSVDLQMWMYLKGVFPSEAEITPAGTRFGNIFIPTDRLSFMRLNYFNLGKYPKVSFADVLDHFAPGTFNGKIVMIGASASGLGDLKSVPGYRSLPGVEIHAAALSTLLSGRFVTLAPRYITLPVSLAAGIAAGLILAFYPLLPAAIAAGAVIPFLVYIGAFLLYIRHSMLMNVGLPVMTVMFMVLVMLIHRFVQRHERNLFDPVD